MRAAARLSRIPISFWAEVGQAIATLRARGMDVIRLDVGDPDMPPREEIIDTLSAAAHAPESHRYPGGSGAMELRQAIAGYYARRFGVTLDPAREVLPLIGSKEGIAHVALAFVDPGDLVLVPEPAYPTYRMGTYLAGGEVCVVPLLPENDYLPDLAAIPAEVARRAKILWLNYPHNPTGAVATPDLFAAAVEFARSYDLLICHDAPYCDVYYDGYRPPSMLETPGARDVVLEFNSLSKTYNMAGWRVAMAVGSREAVAELARVKSNTDSGIFLPVQRAAIAALSGDQGWIEPRNAIYQARRDLILAALRDAGLAARTPVASLYIWAEVPAGYTSLTFTKGLLEAQGVSVSPGAMYGAGGERHIRISVTAPTPRIEEAMRRLRAYCASIL